MNTSALNFINVSGRAHLVSISPREVLDTNVLVGVFDTLLERGKVVPVLPVLSPEVVSIDTSKDQSGNDSAAELVSVVLRRSSDCPVRRHTRLTAFARGLEPLSQHWASIHLSSQYETSESSGKVRTTRAGCVLLDSGSFAVELVVDHPRRLRLSAVEAALHSSAHRSAAELLPSTLG